MSNTELPTGLNSGNTDHIGNHNTIHSELNELTRSTGRRNVESLLINGWRIDGPVGSGIHIERIRNEVYLHIRGLDGVNATSAYFLRFGADSLTEVSARFRPDGVAWQGPNHFDGSYGTWAPASANDQLLIVSGTDYRRSLGGYWRTFMWTVGDVWPSFLPPAV